MKKKRDSSLILKVKGLISSLLILLGVMMFFTGAILYFSKYGMWWVFTRKFINDVHVLAGLFMGITIIIHFVLNGKLYKAEMKQLMKGESKESSKGEKNVPG